MIGGLPLELWIDITQKCGDLNDAISLLSTCKDILGDPTILKQYVVKRIINLMKTSKLLGCCVTHLITDQRFALENMSFNIYGSSTLYIPTSELKHIKNLGKYHLIETKPLEAFISWYIIRGAVGCSFRNCVIRNDTNLAPGLGYYLYSESLNVSMCINKIIFQEENNLNSYALYFRKDNNGYHKRGYAYVY